MLEKTLSQKMADHHSPSPADIHSAWQEILPLLMRTKFHYRSYGRTDNNPRVR